MNGAVLFGSVETMLAAVALALIVSLALWREAFRRRSARRWLSGGSVATGSRAASDQRRASRQARWLVPGWRPALMTLAATAIAGAAVLSAWNHGLAKPAADRAPAAIVFALDVSRSMEVSDIPPSRLDAARALIARIVADAAPSAAGLVVFAGEAELTCPLTSDLDAFRMALEEVPATMGTLAGGSELAGALTRSAATFGASRARKIVVLLSDGEDTGPAGTIEETAARLNAARIAVVTVGLGTAGGAAMPVRRPDPNSGSDASGSGGTRVARPDVPRLQRLAAATSGAYLDGADARTAPRLVARLRSPAAASERAGRQGGLPAALLVGAFVCLSVEWLLGLGGRGRV